jgi:uncharacterized damage-inducible protein DinB
MAHLQPDQAIFLLKTVYLPGMTNESRTTRAVIAAIPPDKADYRPDEISKSAFDLAWHIVSAEFMFMDAAIDGAFQIPPPPRPESVKTSADVAQFYDEGFAGRAAKLSALSGDDLIRVTDFRGMFQLPAVMFLDFGLHHSIHHRGQLSTYLRPMGGRVPAIYGESYDSRIAAAQPA